MSLFDRIRQEAVSPTVKVPQRNDLILSNPEISSDLTEIDNQEDDNKAVSLEKLLIAELESLPIISKKKVGVRLESEILENIQELCRNNNITVETLLEAFYQVCNVKDTLMRQVIKDAQNRIQRRTRAGNIRSILTKSKNLKMQKK